MIAFGELVEELLIKGKNPANLTLRDKSGFFGIEAHKDTPVEVLAIALLSKTFASYRLLVVDSFQIMGGAAPAEINAGIGKLRSELETLAGVFGLNFDITLCSEFFERRDYQDLFKDIEAAVKRSTELIGLLRSTIPDGEDKSKLGYAIHEVATTAYLHATKGVNVKVGQQRERLYDILIKELVKGLNFAYMTPFYAFGTSAPEEVTPYKPTSGSRNGGKRILIGGKNFADSYDGIARTLCSGPVKAQEMMYLLTQAAGAAGIASGSIRIPNAVIVTSPSQYFLDRALLYSFAEYVIRPYETVKARTALDKRLKRFRGFDNTA